VTVEILESKIEERTKHMSDTTPTLEALCWFISVREARAVFEARLKDIASLIREGHPIGGPYQTREDVEQWIADVEGNEEEDPWGWIDKALDDHFGIMR